MVRSGTSHAVKGEQRKGSDAARRAQTCALWVKTGHSMANELERGGLGSSCWSPARRAQALPQGRLGEPGQETQHVCVTGRQRQWTAEAGEDDLGFEC